MNDPKITQVRVMLVRQPRLDPDLVSLTNIYHTTAWVQGCKDQLQCRASRSLRLAGHDWTADGSGTDLQMGAHVTSIRQTKIMSGMVTVVALISKWKLK